APAHGMRQDAVAGTANARSVSQAPPPCEDYLAPADSHSSRGIEHTVALGQFDVREMLLVVAGEQGGALHVDREEVQPVPRRGLFGRGQRRLARRADGCGRKTWPLIGIPW